MHVRAGHVASAVTAAAFLAVLCTGWYRPRPSAPVVDDTSCATETNRARVDLFADDQADTKAEAELDAVGLATAHVRLERSSCMAKCAAYAVTIHGNGRVEYVGIDNVAHVGARSARIPEAWARRVFVQFLKAGFFALPPEEERLIPNAPTYSLTLELGDRMSTFAFFFLFRQPGLEAAGRPGRRSRVDRSLGGPASRWCHPAGRGVTGTVAFAAR